MTHRHRTWHFRIWLVLPVIVVALYLAALYARPHGGGG